jgi:hypothetical protein
MKQVVALLFVIFALSSCGMRIQNRLYRDGFYVSRSGDQAEIPKYVSSPGVILIQSPDSTSLHGLMPQSSSVAAADTVETLTALRATISPSAITKISPKRDTLNFPVQEPSPKTVDQQITDLHKLDVATKISLLLWLTIIGSAIGIPAAFVLSLITLIKIKRLKREHPLSEKQLAATEKIRRHARAVLWISSILIALLLVALITLLFVPWSVVISGPFLSM